MLKIMGDIELPESLPEEVQLEYFRLYQESKSLYYRNLLVSHNLRLIVSVINEKFFLTDEEESFSLGCEALMRSVERYDLSRGKFSAFACKAIENEIRHNYDYNNRKKRSGSVVSLYASPYNSDDGSRDLTYVDIIMDEKTSMTEVKEILYAVKDFLETISYRDKRMFELYYGLNGEREHFEKEIGAIFNVSRQRVSEKNRKTLENLKEYLMASGFDIASESGVLTKKR